MFYTGVWSKSHINKKTICEEQYDVFKFFNCFKSLHFRYSIERFRLKYKLDLCTMVDKLVKKKYFFLKHFHMLRTVHKAFIVTEKYS